MRAARIRFASRFTSLAGWTRFAVRASEDYAEFGYHAASNEIQLRNPMEDILRRSALEYHLRQPPGKISVTPTKGLLNQRDLALAYTPGVAAACDEIVRDPAEARRMTARANLIGVVTNGTAVLGLGPIGPLASKPVMEGKAVLFKKFAGIDCF